MTFLQLQDDVLDRMNLPGSARTRVKRNINEWYRRITSALGLGSGRDGTAQVSVVAGTAEYTVTASKIKFMRDKANGIDLTEKSLSWMRSADPGDESSGTPIHYAIRKHAASQITFRLFPIPSANGTLDLDILTAVAELTLNGDIPTLIHEDYHWLLATGARLNEYEKQDDARFKAARDDIAQGIRELRMFLRRSSRLTTSQSEYTQSPSRLGPWFTE